MRVTGDPGGFLQPALAEGERVLWQGAPAPGIHGWPQRLFMAAFGVPFAVGGCVMVFFGAMMLGGGEHWGLRGIGLLLLVFAIPFLAVGLYLVVLQWPMALQAHARTLYTLTDRAGYIASRWWARSLVVLPILPGTLVEMIERRGLYTLWLHVLQETDSDGKTTEKKGFESIAEGPRVLALIRQVQAAGGPG